MPDLDDNHQKLPRFRFTISRMMIAVALTAICLFVGMGIWSFVDSVLDDPLFGGRNSGLLFTGQAVVLNENFPANKANQARWPIGKSPGKGSNLVRPDLSRFIDVLIPSGTRAYVMIEPAYDEDDCYGGNRLIAVKISQGPHLDLEMALPRRLLRKR